MTLTYLTSSIHTCAVVIKVIMSAQMSYQYKCGQMVRAPPRVHLVCGAGWALGKGMAWWWLDMPHCHSPSTPTSPRPLQQVHTHTLPTLLTLPTKSHFSHYSHFLRSSHTFVTPTFTLFHTFLATSRSLASCASAAARALAVASASA